MAYIVKETRWKNHLRHSINLSKTEWPLIAKINPHNKPEPDLKDEVFFWLEENIGYIKGTDWHKDPWHPPKPKFYFEASSFQTRYVQQWYCTIRFYDLEDAFAFKLRWL